MTLTQRYRTTKDLVEHHSKICKRIIALSPSSLDEMLFLMFSLFIKHQTSYERKYQLSLKLHEQAKSLEARVKQRTSVRYPAIHLN